MTLVILATLTMTQTLISCLLSTVWYYKTVWNNIIIVYFKSDDCIHTPEVKILL